MSGVWVHVYIYSANQQVSRKKHKHNIGTLRATPGERVINTAVMGEEGSSSTDLT